MAEIKCKMIVAHAGKQHLNKEIVIDDGRSEEIDENQRHINRLMGVGDDVYFKYSRGLSSPDPDEQVRAKSVLEEFHKAGDMVFCTYQNHPEKWPAIIDECQRKINALMGVSDETFLTYQCKEQREKSPAFDEEQRKINEMCGVSDETFLKYGKGGR